MSATIIEVLENADYNLQKSNEIGLMFAKEQLHNAVELLNKGYGLYDEVEPLLEKYGDIDSVPDKKEEK